MEFTFMGNLYGPYFTEKELGLDNNYVSKKDRESMFLLVKFALNPLREKYGPIRITSGYRDKYYNSQIGGANTSQHIQGEAVDLWCLNLPSNREAFEWLRTWWPGQVFYYEKKGHIHIGLPRVDLAVSGRLYAQVLDK